MLIRSSLGSLIVALALISGCTSHHSTSPPSRSAERITYRTWPDAVRLTNGTAELIVVPSIGGRIVRYGLIGGENLLWEDPAAPEPSPCTVESIDRQALRISTPVASQPGLRMIREIRMSDHGSRVTLESRLVRGPGNADVTAAFAPRLVTQVPSADFLLAHIADDASNPPFRPLPPHAAAEVERIGREVLRITPPTNGASGIGLDADMLAWVKGSTFVMQRLPPVSALPSARGERAQVFFQVDESRHQYTELEFAAPRGDLSRSVLRVTWEIHDLPRDLGTPENVAAYIVRF